MVIGGAPSWQIRNHTARELIEWGFDNFTSRELLRADTVVGTARVQEGSPASVSLRTEANVFTNLPSGENGKVRLSVRYLGPIKAPISNGDEVATLRIVVPGQQPHDVPVIAAYFPPTRAILRRISRPARQRARIITAAKSDNHATRAFSIARYTSPPA